ncbi:hypothetical protein GCM10022204_19470 [Microlunatus aurantiacus]|uniref:Uncharacterized protein n=1 Tax=Microlunatus aurantiacus TaxID=446786 RepID=A0ABP7DCS5_9ACTN
MTRRGGEQGAHRPDRIVADLNTEWGALADAGEVVGWASRHRALGACHDLAGVLAAIPADPDATLGALLRESEAGSALAARTVLQAMLGKVVLMARHDSTVGTDAYVAAMWERIRTYPLDRRPVHIAGNLALDTRKLARRESGWDLRVTPWPPGTAFTELADRERVRNEGDHGQDTSLVTAGEVIRAALQLELIDAAAGELLGAVYGDGLSSRETSRRLLTTPQAVRQRCRVAVRRLADHSLELASLA